MPDPRKRKAARADAKYIRFAEQVVNLRENHNLKLADIAETLNIGVGTVARAYDYLRPEVVKGRR